MIVHAHQVVNGALHVLRLDKFEHLELAQLIAKMSAIEKGSLKQ